MFSVISDDSYNSTAQQHPSLTRSTLCIAFPVQSSTLSLSCCFFLFIFQLQFQKMCQSAHSNAQHAHAQQTVTLSTHTVYAAAEALSYTVLHTIHSTPHLAVLQCVPPTELCGAWVQNTFVGQIYLERQFSFCEGTKTEKAKIHCYATAHHWEQQDRDRFEKRSPAWQAFLR